MSTFTPPSIAEVSPIQVADSQHGLSAWVSNKFGQRLFRFYSPRQRGVTVYKMSDGTYQLARSVPGLSLTVNEPYPATTPDQFPQTVNGTMEIATSVDGNTQQTTFYPAQQPQVAIVYYGGHSYQVSSAEAADLTAAGLGAYLS